jgi:molybdenum cofactor guanylyltransferase
MQPNLPSAAISGLILAGGRGTRMGGADKGLVDWHGRPLAAWVADAMRPCVTELLISANRNLERYAALAERVIADELSGFQGPLAGLAAGLAQARGEAMIYAACDMPALTPEIFHRLLTAPGAAIAHDGERLQYGVGKLPSNSLHGLHAYLENGGRRLGEWLESLHPTVVDCADLHEAFRNVNRLEGIANT